MNNFTTFQFIFFGPLMVALIAVNSVFGFWTAIFIPCFIAIGVLSFGIFALNFQIKIGEYFFPKWIGVLAMAIGAFVIISQIYF